MKKILVICPGYRDPFWNKEHLAMTTSSEKEKRAVRTWIEQTTTLLMKNKSKEELLLGAVLTTLGYFIRQKGNRSWKPDEIWLPYMPDEEMNFRVGKLVTFFNQKFKIKVQALNLRECNVAHYGQVAKALFDRLGSAINSEECENPEFRFIIGPATPALNFALILFAINGSPNAKVFQILNPLDVRRTYQNMSIKAFPKDYLVELKFDGKELPLLQTNERMRTKIKQLQQENLELRNQLNMQSRTQTLSVNINDDIRQIIQEERVLEAIKQAEISTKAAFIQTAIEIARENGQQVNQSTVAKILQTSRQNIISWAAAANIKI